MGSYIPKMKNTKITLQRSKDEKNTRSRTISMSNYIRDKEHENHIPNMKKYRIKNNINVKNVKIIPQR
jgi:hypothetical protein